MKFPTGFTPETHKRRRTIRTIIFFFAFLGLLWFGAWFKDAAMHKAMYQKQSLELGEKLTQILIDKSVCIDKERDCRSKGFMFIKSIPYGLSISFYDVKNDVLASLVNASTNAYFENNQKMDVYISIYNVSKAEDVASGFWKNNKVTTIHMEHKE